MIEVFVCPSARLPHCVQEISHLLSRAAGAAFLTPECYLRTLDAQSFLVVSPPPPCINAPGCILVLPEEALCIPQSALGTSVVLCGDEQAPPDAGQRISCGMGIRDTITLSSVTADSAVLSVQRPIVTLSGNSLGPMDLPVTPCEDISSLLAAAAILLLADLSPPTGSVRKD